jgi:hypothetical protein
MLDRCYQKTAKGREELATRQYRLGARLRQALILLDGHGSARNLVRILGDEAAVERALQVLCDDGFVVDSQYEAAPPFVEAAEKLPAADAVDTAAAQTLTGQLDSNLSKDGPIVVTVDQARMEGARIIMLNTADRYLGLMGADLARRISSADDATVLKAIVPRWHLALRESRHGRADAQQYLDTVMASLDR